MGEVRAQVRRQALQLFLERGYAGASLRDIAAAVGVTPAAVYYHYRTKDALLDDLLEPLLSKIEDLLSTHEHGGSAGPATRRLVLGELLDTLLTDRDAFRFASSDIAVQNHPSVGPRIAAANDRLDHLLAPRPADRVLAQAALGVLFRPLTRRPDEPLDQIRDHLVSAALCALDSDPGRRPA